MSYPLQKYYSRIASRYDLVNRLFTFRRDQAWRRMASKECLADNAGHILDLCCGTGDLAIMIARKAKGRAKVSGYDFSHEMLNIARLKSSRAGLVIEYSQGDAASMQYGDNTFDSIGITFGFRNLTFENPNSEKYILEILRVLKSKGKFVIVESNQPGPKLIRFLYKVYLKVFIYPLGGLLSGDFEAYKYLTHSSDHFYSPDEVMSLLTSHGFSDVSYKKLFMGAAALYVAWKK